MTRPSILAMALYLDECDYPQADEVLRTQSTDRYPAEDCPMEWLVNRAGTAQLSSLLRTVGRMEPDL